MTVVWSSTPWRCLSSRPGSLLGRLATHEGTSPSPYFHTFGLCLQAAVEIAKLIGYLQRHQERVDCRCVRKGGYPSGNGGIDAAKRCLARNR
jgi:hypothetical protein